MQHSKRRRLTSKLPARGLLEGPTSLKELFDWPADIIRNLAKKDGVLLDRLRSNLQIGIDLSTDFSGYDTPPHILNVLVQALSCRGVDLGPSPIQVCRNGDLNQDCQTILTRLAAHRVEHGLQPMLSCVFRDLNECLDKDTLNLLDSMEPTSQDAPEIAAAKHNAIMQLLLTRKTELFSKTAQAHCVCHGKKCSVRPEALRTHINDRGVPGSDRRIQMNVAGTICKGWSTQGKMRGLADKSMRPHNIWLAERSSVQEDLIFQECTPRCNIKLIEESLPTHRVIRIWWGPQQMGWPCVRERSFSVSINRKTVIWVGPETEEEIIEDFGAIFERSRVVDGDMLFCSHPDNVRDDICRRFARRGTFITGDCIGINEENMLSNLMPQGMHSIYKEYSKVRAARQSQTGCFIADLSQHEGVRGRGGPCCPALLCNCQYIFSYAEMRFCTALEAMGTMGFHVHDIPDCPFTSPMKDLACTDVLPISKMWQMVGNSMSMPALGAWMSYVLAHVIPVEKAYIGELGVVPPSTWHHLNSDTVSLGSSRHVWSHHFA